MVHGNPVLIREDAKQARSSQVYIFNVKLHFFNSLASLSIKQTTPQTARNYLLT